VLQVVALTAYLLPLPEVLQPVVVAVMAVAVLVTLVTGAEIAFQALRLRTTSSARTPSGRPARADGPRS
jgi:CDP-diacylglycerol--glycerol-3-phosphate 3-phosphatidyltransferase